MSKIEKRLFNQFVKENWDNPEGFNYENFKNWVSIYMAKHPNTGVVTHMHHMQKVISDKLKEILKSYGLEPKDIRFIELQSHILSNLIDLVKKQYGVPKLRFSEEWDDVADAFDKISNWPELIDQYKLEGAGWDLDLPSFFDKGAKRDDYYDVDFSKGAYKGTYGRNRYIDLVSKEKPAPIVPGKYELVYGSPTRKNQGWDVVPSKQWGDMTPLGPSSLSSSSSSSVVDTPAD
jgi:hypothetical protein